MYSQIMYTVLLLCTSYKNWDCETLQWTLRHQTNRISVQEFFLCCTNLLYIFM